MIIGIWVGILLWRYGYSLEFSNDLEGALKKRKAIIIAGIGGFGPDFDVVIGLIVSLVIGKGVDVDFILLFHGIPTHTIWFFGGLVLVFFIFRYKNAKWGKYWGYFLIGYLSHFIADFIDNRISGLEPFIPGTWGLNLVDRLPSYLSFKIFHDYTQIAIWDAIILLTTIFLIYYAIKLYNEIRHFTK